MTIRRQRMLTRWPRDDKSPSEAQKRARNLERAHQQWLRIVRSKSTRKPK